MYDESQNESSINKMKHNKRDNNKKITLGTRATQEEEQTVEYQRRREK